MPPAKKGAERRRWERLPLAIPVFVRGLDTNGKHFIDFATALDISVGGALLAIHRHLPPGSKIMLEIPSAPVAHTNKVPRAIKRNFHAKAVRVTAGESCQLVGLKFQKPLLVRRPGSPPKPQAKGKGASTL